jgi:hypothetical protein
VRLAHVIALLREVTVRILKGKRTVVKRRLGSAMIKLVGKADRCYRSSSGGRRLIMPGQFTPSEAILVTLVAYVAISAAVILGSIAFRRGERE